ncbi:hypothetical protein Hdeb2414_s0006g00213321 [Helianthus debilis subsp. tardiflorus]
MRFLYAQSKSQAEQMQGRTGRTCDSEVYRFVTEPSFWPIREI